MSKYKGFTLVELIVSIAILSISFVGISSALIGGVHNEKRGDAKLETSTYGKAIVENIKVQGNVTLSGMDKVKYIFFDDKSTLEYCLYDLIFNGLDGTGDSTKTGNDVLSVVGDSSLCTYDNCKAENEKQNRRKYGGFILVESENSDMLYHIQVWLWNFDFGESSLSKREFYIRRW